MSRTGFARCSGRVYRPVNVQAFVAHVQRLLSGEQDGSGVTPGILAPAEKPVVARWRPIAVMLVVIVALGLLGNWLWSSARGRQDAGAPSIAVERSAARAPVFNPPAHSIAVLPFLDLSEKRDQEYFSGTASRRNSSTCWQRRLICT